ncbi:MAG TPA: nickel-dependent hydrogenase large subunit, partial [Solirubrobacteraceae bacterium]|nr:nickel-dependent hydrogenase large subunit [Solirubrobacteraceae bacterium]
MSTEPLTAVSSRPPRWLPDDMPGTVEPGPADEVLVAVPPERFEAAVRALHRAGARFVTMLVAERPERSLVAVVALRGALVSVRCALPGAARAPHEPIGRWWPAARWAERELVERGALALASEPAGRPLTRPDADAVDGVLRGLDAFAIPYGPIRSGVFEAIQFLIETGGEDVPQLQTRPFFKHRGLERRFAGMDCDRAVHVAERVAGIATVAHASAFCQAVERALGIEPPARAQRWRAVLAELERVANHCDVIAKQAETTALVVGQARFQILKERVLRLQAALTGSRFARGALVPGGLRVEPRLAPGELLDAVAGLERDLRPDRRMFLGTSSMTDRLIGSGRVERALMEQHGAVGPLARGSGLSTDARHERPYGDYRRLGVEVVTARGCDAMARVEVRFGEIAESLRIVRAAVDQLR